MSRALAYAFCCLTVFACLAGDLTGNANALYRLGSENMEAEQWGAARHAFTQALEVAKKHGLKADIELQIGRCLQAEDKPAEAMKRFVNSMRWRFYSAQMIRRSTWPEGRDEFQRILAVPVTRETAETVIFKALAEIGLAQEWRTHASLSRAETHYRKALEWLRAAEYSNTILQQRDLRMTYLGLAEVYADRQDYPAAQDALRQFLEIPGDARSLRAVQHRLWALCRLAGGFAAMRAKARESIASSTVPPRDHIEAQFQIAYSYVYERRYDDARTEFAAVLPMPEVSPAQCSEAKLYLAHTFFVARRYAEARPIYESILTMDAADPACVSTARARVTAIDALADRPKQP